MNETKTTEIEIKKIVNLLIRRAWIVIFITVVTTCIAMFYNSMTKPTPLYQSSASLIIRDSSGFIKTLMVFLKEPPVMDEVKEELQLTQSNEALKGQITVAAVQDSQIVNITVEDPDIERAATIANTTAEVFIRQVDSTLNFQNIEVISSASVKGNERPINPPSDRIITIGFIFGIVVGIGFVFLLDSLDNKIRTERELEKLLALPVLGTISKHNYRRITKSKGIKTKEDIRGDVIESKIS